MIIEMRALVVFFCVIFTVLSCGEKSSQSASDYSGSLIILKSASNVKYYKIRGTDQVSYKIIAQYPAKYEISELNNRLSRKGWKPLKNDWLNPEIPTSHERGWTNSIDATKEPNLEVHSWNSDWTNEKEDILTFVLRYSYPVKTKSNMLELNVIGIYVPEELAKKTVAQINKYKKSIGEK